MQSVNTVEYPTLSCKSRGAREVSPSIIFSTLLIHDIFRDWKRFVCKRWSLPPPPPPPLSLYHLLSKFANSLDAEDLRRPAKPNQGQTGIPRINNESERPTLRPMPRKNIIEPWHEISNIVVCGTIVFPPAPKKGMVKFPGKGHFKRAKTG